VGLNEPATFALSSEDFRLLFESAPNPYLIIRPNTPVFTIVAVSDSYLKATSTLRADIIGRGLFEVFPANPDDPATTSLNDLRISLERVIQECIPDMMGIQKYDIPQQGEEGDGFKVKYWSPANIPVFSTEGDIAFILHRVEDVTDFVLLRQSLPQVQERTGQIEAEILRNAQEVKEANRQLKTAKEELEYRENELKRLNERLKELDNSKTIFFSNVSHEFRTPLTLILGPIQDILSTGDALSDTHRYHLETAYHNALRLQKLVNTLLDFSRIEAGRVQASYQPTDLVNFTRELVSMFDSAVEHAGLKLVIECSPFPEMVYVDHDMWEKIVLNLLSNAFKHTFEGEITVQLKHLKDHIEFVVRDTGVGIPSDQLPHLFERFYRVANTCSRTHEGSGIGLALVQELVKLHGGSIKVDSVIDQGTIFTVTIPTGKAHLDASQIVAPSDLPSTAQPFVEEALRWLPGEEHIPISPNNHTAWPGVVSAGKARILLADDNRDMRNYVQRLLEPYCTVEAVSDGLAALEAARRVLPDLVLSDVMMPKMNGFELIDALRSDPSLQKIPVIILSARAGEEAKVEGLKAGADDYLVKPFNARELLARVKTNLDLHRTRHQETIKELEKMVAERTAELQAVNQELEAFSYSVSHDLRAPLRAIDGFSLAVIEDYGNLLDEQGKNYLQRIRQGSQQMAQLIEDMLNLSKLTREELNLIQSVNLSSLAQDIAAEFKRQEPERRVEFNIQENLIAKGDKYLLQVVLQNLLGNAWKFTSKHPQACIKFGTLNQDGKPVYYVKDDGVGFDSAYANKLFNVFQRLHTLKEFPGTGVGLVSTQRIIHRHGGKIWAEGEVEKGATFYFTLGSSELLE